LHVEGRILGCYTRAEANDVHVVRDSSLVIDCIDSVSLAEELGVVAIAARYGVIADATVDCVNARATSLYGSSCTGQKLVDKKQVRSKLAFRARAAAKW
jgi:hypothetical protein